MRNEHHAETDTPPCRQARRLARRGHCKAGDLICFYATTKGVVAHAKVKSAPLKKSRSSIRHPETYPWLFELQDSQVYLDNPVVIDPDLRSQLAAFRGRDPDKSWAWFVQSTRRLSEHDFRALTRREDTDS